MKKYLFACTQFALICSWCLLFTSCSNSDDLGENSFSPLKDVVINSTSGSFNTNRCKTLYLIPTTVGFGNLVYEWSMGDKVISQEKVLPFVSQNIGNYNLTLKVIQDTTTITEKITVTVSQESSPYNLGSVKVLEYVPAPGQFCNTLPSYLEGDTQESMNRKAQSMLEEKGVVSLGAYGGYIIVGFDHTIINAPNKKDFKVGGNAFYDSANPKPGAAAGGSCEPGIVEVAFDKNGNGKPDEDEWYELAGSEYYNSTTQKNYEITYYKPDENKIATPDMSSYTTDNTYCKWTDNTGKSGYIYKSSFHEQPHYPQWTANKLTFKGTLIANNAVDESGKGTHWVLYSYPWGYADNAPNNSDLSNMDIDWAVDKQGNKIYLPGVDFIKVYTGVLQQTGWLGETSTEVSYFEDLNYSKQ